MPASFITATHAGTSATVGTTGHASDGRPILMIPPGRSYEQAQADFRWPRPARFNIARAVCDRHPPASLGMIVEDAGGSVRNWTFGELSRASARLANALKARGVVKGDRVAVFLSQSAELAI